MFLAPFLPQAGYSCDRVNQTGNYSATWQILSKGRYICMLSERIEGTPIPVLGSRYPE